MTNAPSSACGVEDVVLLHGFSVVELWDAHSVAADSSWVAFDLGARVLRGWKA